MNAPTNADFIVFDKHQKIARGSLPDVARAAKRRLDADSNSALLVFDAHDSRRIEIDLHGTMEQVLARVHMQELRTKPTAAGPGRPKLGVVAREVTLLPRHWDWLGRQPGGTSAAIRHLVEQALRGNDSRALAHQAMESVERFMLSMAGDLPGYEEASRAFYRSDKQRFAAITKTWPKDIRDHAQALARAAWSIMAANKPEAAREKTKYSH
ncbi:MAG TPA: DUF2239 family protein [Rudaea sp.]|nr:DUF2239 family protein [Rudaea sp.]